MNFEWTTQRIWYNKRKSRKIENCSWASTWRLQSTCVRACVKPKARSRLPHQNYSLAAGGAIWQLWTRYQLLSKSVHKQSATRILNCGEHPIRHSKWGISLIPLGLSGETASRENCSLPLNCLLYCSPNINSLVECSLYAPPCVLAETSYLLAIIICLLYICSSCWSKWKDRSSAILLAIYKQQCQHTKVLWAKCAVIDITHYTVRNRADSPITA